jgi:hypothetical protein
MTAVDLDYNRKSQGGENFVVQNGKTGIKLKCAVNKQDVEWIQMIQVGTTAGLVKVVVRSNSSISVKG